MPYDAVAPVVLQQSIAMFSEITLLCSHPEPYLMIPPSTTLNSNAGYYFVSTICVNQCMNHTDPQYACHVALLLQHFLIEAALYSAAQTTNNDTNAELIQYYSRVK